MKNKKVKLILIGIFSLIVILIGLYFYGLTSVSSKKEIVKIEIPSGEGRLGVIKELYEKKMIKSRVSSTIYVLLHPKLIIQAGTYELSRDFSAPVIFKRLNEGNLYVDGVKVTLIEGKKITDYIKVLEENLGFKEEDILKVLSDQKYLQSLRTKYDFLGEEVLNDQLYYSLEGYIFPATYNFSLNMTIEEVLEATLKKTGEILEEFKSSIAASGFTNHEILTMASIIENETMRAEDRSIASQVIHKRLEEDMNLGMDVTTYYGVRKNLGEALTELDLNDKNAYNTRVLSFKGLPVGPISSPSKASIEAALNPSDTNYLYFYADKDGKLHFAETYPEFLELQELYRW